jgi:uncharacterized protein (TIGR02246 family)
MRKVICLGALLMLVAAGLSWATPEEDAALSKVRAAVDKGNAQYIAAFANADAAALSAVYDADGTRLHENGALTRGRQAIAAEVRQFLERVGAVAVTIETLNLWVVDDRAYETGKWSYTFTPPEKEEVRLAGRYVTVWKKQADGGWKIVADMSVPCGEGE